MSLQHQYIARPLSRHHHNIVYSITTSSIRHHYLVTTSLVRDRYITPSSHHRHNIVINLSGFVTIVPLHCHMLPLQYQWVYHNLVNTSSLTWYYIVNTWLLHQCYTVTASSYHRHCITGTFLLCSLVRSHLFSLVTTSPLRRDCIITTSSNHRRNIVITSS